MTAALHTSFAASADVALSEVQLIASPARAAYGGRAAAGPASWRGRPGHGGRNQNGAGQVASPRSRAARRTRHAGSGDRLAPGRRRPAALQAGRGRVRFPAQVTV